MLRVNRLPGSLAELLEEFGRAHRADIYHVRAAGCGADRLAGGRTVCGMLAGAGLGGVGITAGAPVLRAAAWSADAVGLVVLRLAAAG